MFQVKKYMRKILSIAFIVISLSNSAQNYITVKGKILSNDKAVEFANITIKDQPIGTITNESGMFEFHIPDSLKNGIFVISCIGYYNFEKQLSKIMPYDSVFELNQRDIQIGEVIVLPKDKTAKDIVVKFHKVVLNNL